jgi:4-hydroxybenzoate polyprenyltransferase
VLASDGVVNLKSDAKASAIRKYLNGEPFEYIGDSLADIPIWKQSSGAIAVNSTWSLKRAINNHGVRVTKEFPRARVSIFTLLKAIRIYQWSKNLLVFAPLFLSHTLLQFNKALSAIEAFVALSAAASAVYVINDLLDLEADRKHPRKRRRPFASGALTARHGVLLIIFLLSLAVLTSIFLPARAQLLIIAYVLISVFYSVTLKSKLFIDITTLAGLYTLRVLYGGAAADVPISPWTLAFSIFLFISLAICKRLTEIRNLSDSGDAPVPGRAYSQQDRSTIVSLGSASGYVAVLVLALYLNSPDVTVLYTRPRMLWLICPLLIYWVSRILIIGARGQMHDDPIVFAFRDRASWIVAAAVLTVVIVSL